MNEQPLSASPPPPPPPPPNSPQSRPSRAIAFALPPVLPLVVGPGTALRSNPIDPDDFIVRRPGSPPIQPRDVDTPSSGSPASFKTALEYQGSTPFKHHASHLWQRLKEARSHHRSYSKSEKKSKAMEVKGGGEAAKGGDEEERRPRTA